MGWIKKINWQNAIGEIIIVIIGIMIAFTLNNYGENLKNSNTKQLYIDNLIDDLKNEKASLEKNIEAYQQKIKLAQTILPYLNGKQEGRDTMGFKIFGLATPIKYRPYDVTYQTMINAGELSLFSDFQLKRQLQEHYSNQDQIKDDHYRERVILEKYFSDFLIYTIDYNKLRAGDLSILDEKTLNNITQSLFGTFRIVISSAKAGISRCEATIQALEQASNKV